MSKQPTVAETDQMIISDLMFELETIIDANGHPQKCWKGNPPSYREYLIPRLEKHKDRVLMDSPLPEPAPREQRHSITYGETLERAYVLAGWLREHDVRVGSKVGCVGYNCINWPITWIAIHLVGATPVMVNAAITADAMTHCLKITKPVVVLCDAPSADTLGPVLGKLKSLGVGEIFSWQSVDHIPNRQVQVLDYNNLNVAPATLKSVIDGEGLEDLGPDTDGTIFFTSGTTGYPKAVLSSQRAGLHNYLSSYIPGLRAALRMGAPMEMAKQLILAGPPKPPVTLLAIPLFHATGCYGQLVRGIHDGTKIITLRKWNVDDAVALMVKHGVTVIGGVPAIPTAILQSGKLPADFELTALSYGGAAPQERLASDLAKRWPTAGAAVGWGMTETNAITCMHAGADYIQRPTSCGPAIPIVGIKIVDPETRQPVPVNTRGLILAYGPNNMTCYYGNEKATKETVDSEGWLDTGDAGYIDDDGFVYISDRIKDIIIRGGENIPSTEIENAVFTDSRVQEAAAVPIPDDMLGELVGVAVCLRPGAKATGDELIATISPKLRFPARPAFIWVSEAPLDRNANGKVVKKDIKDKVVAMYKKRKQGKL